jgi:hypothetical protein
MNWFDYLVRTPWSQKKQDWKEFKQIRKEVRNAESKFEFAEIKIARAFFEEDSYEEVPACVKLRVMYARSKPVEGVEFEYTLMSYDPRRCVNFAPIGDEQLCPCTQCGAYPANKEYYTARKALEQKKLQKEQFWKNKFNQNTK